MNEMVNTSWLRPALQPDVSEGRPGRTQDDLERWEALIERVIDLAQQNGWTKAEVARRIGMPDGTFSQWFSGKYAGRLDNTNSQVERWLAGVEETQGMAAVIPSSPPFVKTKSAVEILETLAYAQMMPDMVIITFEAGQGKTMACRQYVATRPHAHLVTMSPHTKTVHGMLVELAAALDVVQHNPAKLTRAIGKRLERTGAGTLLIVDEAQNLKDDAIDQLRHFVDIYQCGVALVGNTEIYSRFHKKLDGPSYAQIKRRIGKRLKRTKPRPEDLHAFIDAWGIQEDEMRKLLVGIGMKDGALGQIDKTLKLASMIAAGSGKPLSADHIRAAWSNRDVEGMA